jgi:outer membrane protein OmpA-like peptidoglycan-associated protein
MLPRRAARPWLRLAVGLTLPLLVGIAAGADAAAAISTTDGGSPGDAAQASAVGADKLSVYFARRSTELSPEAMATIAENAGRLKSDPAASVTLVGYTDEVGSSSYGVALAQRRAAVVAAALVGMGVDVRQIRSTVYGDEAAATAPCATEPCGLGFRRVEFRYLKPQTADLRWRPPHDALR